MFEKIAKLLEEQRDITGVTPESKFVDLGLDSLDMVDLVMTVEDEFGITIELDDSITTIGELAAKIERLKS